LKKKNNGKEGRSDFEQPPKKAFLGVEQRKKMGKRVGMGPVAVVEGLVKPGVSRGGVLQSEIIRQKKKKTGRRIK